jgi:hypothetical protein
LNYPEEPADLKKREGSPSVHIRPVRLHAVVLSGQEPVALRGFLCAKRGNLLTGIFPEQPGLRQASYEAVINF